MLSLQSKPLEKVTTEKIEDIKKTNKVELDSGNNEINRVENIGDNVGQTSNLTTSINKTSEVTKNTMESSKATDNHTIDIFQNIIGFMNEDKQNSLKNSKEHYERLMKVEEIRHKSEIEAVYYRTKEETLNEISKNILTYAESVKYINEKIKNLGLEIESKEKKIEFDKKLFSELTQELKIEEYKYEDLNNNFNALVASIEKLVHEYKDSMEGKEYLKNIRREKRELQKYIDKIENVELKLLNKEKERLIVEKKLKPKLDEIEKMKLSLKYLQNERDNNEFIGLLSLSNIQKNNFLINNETNNEIIDTEIE